LFIIRITHVGTQKNKKTEQKESYKISYM